MGKSKYTYVVPYKFYNTMARNPNGPDVELSLETEQDVLEGLFDSNPGVILRVERNTKKSK